MQATSSGYAPTNGIDLYYEIYGSGEPLVLIHGGGSTIESNFGYFIPLLAADRQIIAMELQAHGHTKDRGTPTTFEQDADDVAALLAFLKIPQAEILGFSNGGNTAMQLAARHPQVVKKLVIASSFFKRDGLFKGFFDFMKTASLANMPMGLQEAYLAINNDHAALEIMHNRDRDRMIAFVDWPEEMLRNITVPTLLIGGDQDVMTPEHFVEMFRLFPKAQLAILPGGHGGYLGEVTQRHLSGEQPEMAAKLILTFLKE
ncbi:alpha/beta fold hydrolase [Chitinophaga sancti]|uniref:Alpha/beta hydrolase n=1 Tax=Chitinophaga sancti TaxID=1004 RepID=A0A1K1M881_9BACT|nr:alpha/beta hydrolase [Chitinophaga sancti]WQD64563.1 alpha/beta hydrolase [Chitinophaga sancti]WQG89812.1 alpha/beta hydrolase [Chitinophaga sancti]SFW19333.1 Pimeloyl-ACP methyl ester carboxylesterase [Chitinophaga sancti]